MKRTAKDRIKSSLPFMLAVALWLVLLLLHTASVFRTLDRKTVDYGFVWRGERPAGDSLVVIGIDEETFARIDMPIIFWNGLFAQAFTALEDAGAATIGFDLIQNRVFESFGYAEGMTLVQTVADILERGKTDIVFTFLPDKNLYPFDMLLYTLAEYRDLGYANLTVDDDDIIRSQQLFAHNGDETELSFPLLIASRFLDDSLTIRGKGLLLGGEQIISSGGGTGSEVLINFRGSEDRFRQVPFHEMMDRVRNGDNAYMAKTFGGRIVLFGVTTVEDQHFCSFRNAEGENIQLPGILIHANTIDTLLRSGYLREFSPYSLLGSPLLLLFMLLAFCYRKVNLVVGSAITAVVLAGLVAGALLLFERNVVLYFPSSAIGIFLLPLITYSTFYVIEKREKVRVRNIFSSYLNPHILEDLLGKDDSFLFDIKREKVAILFSDVRDFTTISEMLSPNEVAGLLNEYTAAMFDAIFTCNGTLHQYIGDGIMALWGAPVPDKQCCENALRSGAMMLERLAPLNEKWSRDEKLAQAAAKLGRENLFRIGIGIHYADVVVGYIGPRQRMQYTAIGDGVNTAARVEGLNKQFTSEFLVTGEFYEMIKDRVEAEFKGPTPVKGRRPVDIYEIIKIKQDIEQP